MDLCSTNIFEGHLFPVGVRLKIGFFPATGVKSDLRKRIITSENVASGQQRCMGRTNRRLLSPDLHRIDNVFLVFSFFSNCYKIIYITCLLLFTHPWPVFSSHIWEFFAHFGCAKKQDKPETHLHVSRLHTIFFQWKKIALLGIHIPPWTGKKSAV